MWQRQRSVRLLCQGVRSDTSANPKPAGAQIRMSYIASTRGGARPNNPSVTRTDQAHAGRHRFSQLRTQRYASTSTPRASRVFMGSQDLRARTDSRTNKTPHSDLSVPVFSVRCVPPRRSAGVVYRLSITVQQSELSPNLGDGQAGQAAAVVG